MYNIGYSDHKQVKAKANVNPPFLKVRFVPHWVNQLQIPATRASTRVKYRLGNLLAK